MASATWSARVDLPIPGSPPMRITEPLTSPPPSTLLSSAVCVSSRGWLFVSTSCSLTGTPPPLKNGPSETALVLMIASSEKVFHCPHDGHLPIHLGDSKPQFRQTNTVLVFAIRYSLFY